MPQKYSGVTRFDVRGDRGLAARYNSQGRILLQRAIDLVADDAKKHTELVERLPNGVIIKAQTGFSGNAILIDVTALEGCCEWSPDLPFLTDEEEDEGAMFGDGEWGDLRCGDGVGEKQDWYLATVLAQVHLEEGPYKTAGEKQTPCPEEEWAPEGYIYGNRAYVWCRYAAREWDLDEVHRNGGNAQRIFLTACNGIPWFLDFYVDVTEHEKDYDWKQILQSYEGASHGTSWSSTGSWTPCIGEFFGSPWPHAEAFNKWWIVKRKELWREAEVRVTLVMGQAGSIPLVHMFVQQDRYYDNVATHFYDAPYNDRAFYDWDPGQDIEPPRDIEWAISCPAGGVGGFPIPNPFSDAWKQSYNLTRDETTYNPELLAIIGGCPEEEEEEDEDESSQVEDGVYQELSPNKKCVRCVVYRNGEVFCVGPWIDRITLGECADPGTEEEAEEEEEDNPTYTDETPGEDEGDQPPPDPEDPPAPIPAGTPYEEDPDRSPIDVPLEEIQPGWAGQKEGERFYPNVIDDDVSDYTRQFVEDSSKNYNEDRQFSNFFGPDPGKFQNWVEQLLKLPVEDFQNWLPGDLIPKVTGGRVCPEE